MLLKKSQQEEDKNLSEGNLDIDDPVEKNDLTYNHLSFKNKIFNFEDQNGDIEIDINLLNKNL